MSKDYHALVCHHSNQVYRLLTLRVLCDDAGAGSCPCCGTNVIFQRRCMEAIGGFVYGSGTPSHNNSCD
jgi:hypothetical protein